MEEYTYNVVVTSAGICVSLSRSPIFSGIPIGWKAYQVRASSRQEARKRAKERFEAKEDSDQACWQS